MESISASLPSSTNPSLAIAPTHPKLAVKQFNGNIDSHGQTKIISNIGLVTRKDWVIPPRPKPGRKPATDTPPTKRKAQNRAAQRAFRERRAARVGELEVQLEEVKEEQQQRETCLRSKIKQLEAEVERLQSELNHWKLRCSNLDTIFEYEKRAKEATYAELAYLRKGTEIIGSDVAPHSPGEIQRPRIEKQNIQTNSRLDSTSNTGICSTRPTKSERVCIEDTFADTNPGCGDCTLNGRCACIEETLDSLKTIPTSEYDRSHLPSAHSFSGNQSKQSNPCTPLETDFTTHLSTKPNDVIIESIGQIIPPESCGFCEEGTYCLCAEAVATAAASANNEQSENFSTPFLGDNASSTEIDFSNCINVSSQPITTQKNSQCGNGPGTCEQCQTDPRSGVFCRSLSALRGLASEFPEDCCGKSNGGGCCNLTNSIASEKPSLSCADTYKTLSSHKNYDRANTELSNWLGLLNATPTSHPGRGPLEVEAASILEVLRLFDRRFEKEK